MTLERLLDIDRRFLTSEDSDGLKFAEAIFADAGTPTRGRLLIDTLERILTLCKREGIIYPPILLRRKRELQRGTWAPRLPQAAQPQMSDGDVEARKELLRRQAELLQQCDKQNELPGPQKIPMKRSA